MSRKVTITIPANWLVAILSSVVTALVVATMLPMDASAVSPNGNSGYIRRYAANFTTFGQPAELVTIARPLANAQGGTIIYNKNFFVADDINTLYVTISATGDDHFGARLMIACLVDGKPCNPGANPVGGSPSGWLTALRYDNYSDNGVVGFAGDGGGGAGDVHDNIVAYTWCTPFETKAGTHNVQVRFAAAPVPGDPTSVNGQVFLEAVHFFVDGSRVADEEDACTRNVVEANVATEPSTTTAPDGTLIDTTVFAPLVGPSILDMPTSQHSH